MRKKMVYGKLPGVNAADTSCNQRVLSPWPNQVARVAGNRTRAEAKIAGITPDMFIFSGKCEEAF